MIAAIVLAAGASRRYGSPKPLETIDGESWVCRVTRLVLAAGCSPVLVVTGADGDRVARALRDLPAVVPLEHRGWEQGMGSSIAAGIRALRGAASARGALLTTCDQLALDGAVLRRMIDAFDDDPGRIVACAYAGTVGIPVLFGRGWFDRLAELRGDRGAKALLLEAPECRVDIAWPPGAEDRDRRRERDG